MKKVYLTFFTPTWAAETPTAWNKNKVIGSTAPRGNSKGQAAAPVEWRFATDTRALGPLQCARISSTIEFFLSSSLFGGTRGLTCASLPLFIDLPIDARRCFFLRSLLVSLPLRLLFFRSCSAAAAAAAGAWARVCRQKVAGTSWGRSICEVIEWPSIEL